jgi:hypothetical protein
LDVDKAIYDTAAALTTDADVVVRGTVGALRGKELDDGGLGTGESDGFPMAFYDFAVAATLAGNAGGGTIVIGWIDDSDGLFGGISALDPGDHVVLFLKAFADEDTPGIETEGSYYAVLSDDNGVLDIEGNNVVARSPLLTSLEGLPAGKRAEESLDGELLTVPLADLEAVVEKYA